MNESRLISVLTFLTILGGIFATGNLSTTPTNKAALVGSTNTTMSCTSASATSDSMIWYFNPIGTSSPNLIAAFGKLSSSYVATYALSTSTGVTGQLDLIILYANVSTAGTYLCTDTASASDGHSAQFIVFNSDPACSSNATTTGNLVYGQVLQMSCMFSYYGNAYYSANMVWSTINGQSVINVPPTVNTSGSLTTVNSIFSSTAGYFTSFPIYNCTTSFQSNVTATLQSNAAINVPSYSSVSNIFSSSIPVFYLRPANASSVSQKTGDSIYRGTSVTCNIDSNPSSSYFWMDVSYGNWTNSSTIQIWHDGSYNCTASNTVGTTSWLLQNITVFTTTTTSTTTTTTTTTLIPPTLPGGTMSPSRAPDIGSDGGLSDQQKVAIGVGVGVGVGGFILLVLLIILICCCCKKSKTGKYKESRNKLDHSPPPYTERFGPQRSSNPDAVDMPMENYNGSYGGPPGSPNHKDDTLVYAQLQMENTPRSRQPVQINDTGSNYADIVLA